MSYADLSTDERERLRAAFDAGFVLGSAYPPLSPADPALGELLEAVIDDWFVSREIPPAPPGSPDWLRACWETAPLRGVAS